MTGHLMSSGILVDWVYGKFLPARPCSPHIIPLSDMKNTKVRRASRSLFNHLKTLDTSSSTASRARFCSAEKPRTHD